jgi:hypothetical protein
MPENVVEDDEYLSFNVFDFGNDSRKNSGIQITRLFSFDT